MKLTTPPLAPTVIARLAELGVRTQPELREFDPCRAFLLLKKTGLTVTRSVFWQLVAVCESVSISELSEYQRAYWQDKLSNFQIVDIFPNADEMVHHMRQALQQACLAANMGEVPVGAVLVHRGEVIASAHNRCVVNCSVSHHAEIQVIEQAGKILKNYRLNDCDLYVTLEPCVMCAGAIIQARIRRLIFAAFEPKMGAAGSVLNMFTDRRLNGHTAVHSGVLSDESLLILQHFFQKKRQ